MTWKRGQQPWIDPETQGTLVDAWLAAYAENDNVYWATETGHIQNVLDEVIVRLSLAEHLNEVRLDMIKKLADQIAGHSP